MKNRLSDLNNHLFAQIERISEEDLSAEMVEREVQRSTAIVSLADQIVRTADIQLKAARLYADHGDRIVPHLPMIGKSE